jgi:hypothetical protein
MDGRDPKLGRLLNPIQARALLDGMFAQLERDDTIPADVRGLLGRLQPSLHAAALVDQNFFFSERHPARRLIESLLMAGLGCAPEAGGADALYREIEQAVGPLPQGGFETAQACLDALIERQMQEADGRLDQAIAEAVREEGSAHAQLLAEEEVAARIGSGEVEAFIENFLQEQWTRVLAFAYGMRATRPEILPSLLRAMDDLIRSTQPKNTPEARKELIDGLPALLAMLDAWLNVVKWEGLEREAFFAALAERHAIAMRAAHELPARVQLGHRLEVMQKASERELGRRAQEHQEAALAEFMRRIDALMPGDWVEFVRNDGSRLNCRLRWISPVRRRFIFSGRQGQLLFTLAGEALANALRAGRVRLIANGRMGEQAFAQALRELGGDDRGGF